MSDDRVFGGVKIDAGAIRAEPMDLSQVAYDEATGLFYPAGRPDLLPLFAAKRDLLQAEIDRLVVPWWRRALRSVRRLTVNRYRIWT